MEHEDEDQWAQEWERTVQRSGRLNILPFEALFDEAAVGTLTPSYADVVRSTDGSVASQ